MVFEIIKCLYSRAHHPPQNFKAFIRLKVFSMNKWTSHSQTVELPWQVL